MRPSDVLAASDYALLVTFRKDGTPVPTPVWIVRLGTELVVWTNPEAGKVKRLRRSSRIRIAPCDHTGHPRGRLIEGTARIRPDDHFDEVRAALISKYPVMGRFAMLPHRLRALVGRPMPAATIAVSVP